MRYRARKRQSPAPSGSSEKFGDALAELLRESDEFTTSGGSPNLSAFARALNGIPYESLRRVALGEREPTPDLIEAVARVLRVPPTHFAEYRLWLAQREFDVHEVGYERALENLRAWTSARSADNRR